jgi:hypothetical protein
MTHVHLVSAATICGGYYDLCLFYGWDIRESASGVGDGDCWWCQQGQSLAWQLWSKKVWEKETSEHVQAVRTGYSL